MKIGQKVIKKHSESTFVKYLLTNENYCRIDLQEGGKNMKKIIISLLCLGFIGMPVGAVTVPDGTDVSIVPDTGFTSKTVPNTTIKATIKDDVIIDGVQVFKAGDNATFTVADYEKAGAWGNGGEITLGNGYAYDVNGNKHKILLSHKIEGKDKNWVRVTCVCGVLLWPLLLFGFVHGNEAKVNSGLELNTTTAGSFEF